MRSNLNKIIESSRGIERINLDDHLLSERKIFLEGDIRSENRTDIIKALMLMDGQADKEITLYINSPGGDCESGLALYDAIRMTRSKVEPYAWDFALQWVLSYTLRQTSVRYFRTPA